MDKEPRLLVWSFTQEEKSKLDSVLAQVGAPSAVAIKEDQGHLTLQEIIDASKGPQKAFACAEKVIVFYNIPQKGIIFLIEAFKKTDLPRPIYAVVTEHSINWPFSYLVEHLIEEREKMEKKRR